MTTVNGSAPLASAEYAELVARVHAEVAATVPPGSAVLVISKGDAALVELPGLAAAHFPQDPSGGYAGHHPHDSAAAIAHLEELRLKRAGYLVIPATARWWLDFYASFAEHLATHGTLLADVPDTCLIYDLGSRIGDALGADENTGPRVSLDQIREYLENLISTESSVVVLETGGNIAASLAPVRAAGLAPSTLRAADGSLAGLRDLARDGAEYLVVPRAADQWLERHADVAASIESSCRKIADQRHVCRVFELKGLWGEG
jgi:hypothetical protein